MVTITAENIPEYGFSLTRLFPYKDSICDSDVIREYTGHRKPEFCHILHSELVMGNDISQMVM